MQLWGGGELPGTSCKCSPAQDERQGPARPVSRCLLLRCHVSKVLGYHRTAAPGEEPNGRECLGGFPAPGGFGTSTNATLLPCSCCCPALLTLPKPANPAQPCPAWHPGPAASPYGIRLSQADLQPSASLWGCGANCWATADGGGQARPPSRKGLAPCCATWHAKWPCDDATCRGLRFLAPVSKAHYTPTA